MQEAKISDPKTYEHFNAFFTRELKEGARTIDDSSHSMVCPVDGGVYEFGNIEHNQLLQAKDHYYTLESLLADERSAERYYEGRFACLYLAPKDYHRIHLPLAGTLLRMTHVPGRLFSVNPTSVKSIDNLFARNERVIAYFDTDYGEMAVVMIGAMIVGSVATTWSGIVSSRSPLKEIRTMDYTQANHTFHKGAEIGQFQLGSTVIILHEQHNLQWDGGLASNKTVKMGQLIADMGG